MSELRRRWLGNAFVNVIGGFGAVGSNLLLPALVSKHLKVDEFSVWNLSLQIIAFVNLLGLGLQTATARCIAYASESTEASVEQLSSITQEARWIARVATIAAISAALFAAGFYPLLFPRISSELIGDFRFILLCFGIAAALQIASQVQMGAFQGMHRNYVFVGAQTATRISGILGVWIGVLEGASMPILALLLAVSMALQLPIMAVAFKRGVSWARGVGKQNTNLSNRKELIQYCGALSVWSVSMLVVNSVGIIIVGRYDFKLAGAYSIGMTAAAALAGVAGAGLAPLMTVVAGLHSTNTGKLRLASLLNKATLLVIIGLNLLLVVVILFHAAILRLWVGVAYVENASILMILLVSATCLRTVAAPYALMLLGTGLHKRALFSAIAEAFANLCASIFLGIRYGAPGAAVGSLVGAAVGVLGTLMLNAPRTPEITPNPGRFCLATVLLPIFLLVPIDVFLYWIC